MTTEAKLELVDSDGATRGRLTIRCLPDGTTWRGLATIETGDETTDDSPAADVRLLEEVEYQYHIELDGINRVRRIEPTELFSADDSTKLSGRLNAGRTTGTIPLVVETLIGGRLAATVEVRSRKLDYGTEYRHMLRNLAEQGAELIQASFAPGQFAGFQPDQITDAETLYQRFAFVASLLESDTFSEAIDIIRYRPDTSYVTDDEIVDPTRSVKPDRTLVKQLTSAGARQPVAKPIAGMRSVPNQIRRTSHGRIVRHPPQPFCSLCPRALAYVGRTSSGAAVRLRPTPWTRTTGSCSDRGASRPPPEHRGAR